MKILLFSPTLEMGGAEKIIYNFYFFLKKKNINTKIVLFNNNNIFYKTNIEKNDLINLNIKKGRYSIFKIIKIFFKEKPNFIFSNQREANLSVSFANILLLQKFTIIAREAAPLNFNEGALNSKITLFFLRILYKSLNGLIFNSKFTQDSFLRKIKLSNFTTINNPILINSKIKINKKKKKSDNIKFLTCCRLHEEKNIFTLVDYFRKYKLRNSKFELNIVGNGVKKNQLLRYIKKYNLDQNIYIHESQLNLDEFYKSSDLYVSTSLSEGFGNTFLEALYFNLPIISFDNGGIRDILTKSFQGKIIRKNYFSFYNNINFLLNKKFQILHPSILRFESFNIFNKYFNFIQNVRK